MIITIDGPAASGKSSTARAVANRLGFEYLDTGALYRTITLAALRASQPAAEGEALDAFLPQLSISYRYRRGNVEIFLNDEEISKDIRGAEVTANVSAYSALPSVRVHMVKFQRKFSQGRNLIAEGRDMGSVVFPEAELKVFLDSDPSVRAQRRAKDFHEQGRDVDEQTVLGELRQRDSLDTEREHSPLIQPQGAVLLDNSELTIEEQVSEVLRLAEERWPSPRIGPDDLLCDAPTRPRGELLGGMRVIYRGVWLLVRGLLRLLFCVRYHHEERGSIDGPLLVAANHIAWLDPPVAGSIVPRELSFVAKRELYSFKPFGAFIAYFGAVPIKRGTFDRRCFDVLRGRVRDGGAVLFFPEGTRKPVGRLGRAKFGLGLVAQESGAPVLPVYIKGTTRWKRAFWRRDRIDVYLGRPLHIAPLLNRGLENRELLDLFGEGVMGEIARLQEEAGGAFPADGRKPSGDAS